VAQLYPRELGSLFVTSYDLQDNGGNILASLHTGLKKNIEIDYYMRPEFKFSPSWKLQIPLKLELICKHELSNHTLYRVTVNGIDTLNFKPKYY
jgi:hypothetical protein